MYKFAYKFNDDIIFYFDACGNKYVASGGNLAWRINNPGLVRSHSHFSRANGSIGSCGRYAIFSHPQEGRQALIAWLQSKKYFNSTLKTIGEHYQPNAADAFADQLSSLAKISPESKIKSLNKLEFDRLVMAIEKLCDYTSTDNESFSLLPKITAKIENGEGQEDTYLIGDSVVLSKEEAINWILSHRLDAVIVHGKNETVHLRSRPSHCIWNIKMHEAMLPPLEGQIDTLIRTFGKEAEHQCIWAFINGVSNTKGEALASAELISKAAKNEMVLSMPNDTEFFGLKDGAACIVLKLGIDTPIVQWTAKFFRYLLKKSEVHSSHPPVIIFVHSQGAIISEHALELLKPSERNKIRIFTFGGGSFIAPGKCHSDSHNYASAVDLVCSLGSPNLRFLAMQIYLGNKEGKSQEQVIYQLAFQDAMLDLDSTDLKVFETYLRQRIKHYNQEIAQLANVTILDPDTDCKWKHEFKSDCYQKKVKSKIDEYQNILRNPKAN